MRAALPVNVSEHSRAARAPEVPSRGPVRRPGGGYESIRALQRQIGNQAIGSLLGETARSSAAQVQRKGLSVSTPGDSGEREADRAAEQVMRGQRVSTLHTHGAALQRKCAACASGQPCNSCDEERTVQRKAATPGSSTHSTGLEHVARTTGSVGAPLSNAARAFFEPRFGQDFSSVRVHSDAGAAESARALDARAYTLDHHIVFSAGQYEPESRAGQHLLAHELAHVVQQRGTGGTIQRAASDFRVTDIAPEDAANASMIFFDDAGTAIPASEQPKIAALATPAGRNLALNGFASEEGSAASNDAKIAARIGAVDAALAAAGHTGTRTHTNKRTSGLGQINYRHMRAVEVLPAAAPSAVNACGTPGAINAPCGTAFNTAFGVASAAMALANARLGIAADAAANALVNTLFAGVPRATVNSNMAALGAQVASLPAQHRCHSSCDAGCGRPAYNSGSGIGAGGAMMTLCPDFLGSSDVLWRARILIHESAHATTGLVADDIAYANTRLIPYLSPAESVRNTDSYVLLAWLLFSPGSVPIGPSTPDTLVGTSPAEADAARRAVAFMESWLNYGDFDTEILYDSIHKALPPAAGWDPADGFNIETMHRLAPIFGLTDPGAAAPFVAPTAADKHKMAAIHDRFDQMYSAVNWQVLSITKGAAGSDAWGGNGASLPRLKQTVTVGPAFFAMTPIDRIKHLVRLMAKAMSGISGPFVPKYVEALDQIRQHRGIGP